MKTFRGDRDAERKETPESDPKKPYRAPEWEEEEILEKTALACTKMPKFCSPANS